MEDQEENEFEDSEEESEEIEESEKHLQDIINETPQSVFAPGFRPSSLQEITPVLSQAETGGTQARGFRRVFFQDEEEKQDSGIYETQSQRETIGTPATQKPDAYQQARESGAYETAGSQGRIIGTRSQVVGERFATLGPSLGPQRGGMAGGIGSMNAMNNQGTTLDSSRDYESDTEKKRKDRRLW